MSKILIVEDEEAIADLEKDYLELSDFDVTIENTGDKGLEEALSGNYDLVILDLMLPGLDGFEVCTDSGGKGYSDYHGVCEEGRYRQDQGSWAGCGRLYDEAFQPV